MILLVDADSLIFASCYKKREHPEDEKYLASLSERLGHSKQRVAYVHKQHDKETGEADPLKPQVIIHERERVKTPVLPELKEFKDSIEAEAARLEKIDNIKKKFSEAGLDLDEEFFADNEEKLLALSETDTLDFFISNLLPAVKEEEAADEGEVENQTEEEEAGLQIPAVRSTQDGDDNDYSPLELARALQSRDK